MVRSLGTKVKEASKATNIAKLVNSPKYILGIKLENTRMENPIIIVNVV